MMTDVALQVGIHIFLHGTVVLAVAWLIVHKGTNLPAASKHATWVAAFVVLLLLPLGYELVPGWTFHLSMDSPSSQGIRALPGTQALSISSGSVESFLGPSPEGASASDVSVGGTARSSSSPSIRWGRLYRWGVRWLAPGFLFVWAGGVLLLLGRLGVGMWGLWRWRQSAVGMDCSELTHSLARRLNLSRSVSVKHSPEASVPVVWGIVAPVVILPREATGWSRPQLKSVLLHELAHVKRWDTLTHLLGRVVRACFWPNPLAWKAATAATAVQEQACDDAVLRSGVASWEYAEQLLAVTKALGQGPAPVDAVALDTGLQFKSRMRALLKSTPPRRGLTYRDLGLFLGLGTLLLLTVSALHIRSSSSSPDRGTRHWIEAERAGLAAPFAARTDAAASEGEYVDVTRQPEALDRPPRTNPVGYSFDAAESGPHLIWARVRVQSDNQNSLWLRVDSTRWIRWNGIERGERWHWVQVRDADQDGRPVAFDLSEGRHRLYVGAREEGIEVDQFVVTSDWNYRPRTDEDLEAVPDDHSQIWLEAEEGQLEVPFHVENAPDASGWRHVVARPEQESRDAPPPSGRATYSFSVSQAGTYRIWGRIVAASTGSDSFWIRVDGGDWIRWNEIRKGRGWHWDQVHDADAQNRPVRVELSPGPHRLTVAYRERHAKLDRLLLTTDATYRPRGTGDRVDAPLPVSRSLSPRNAALTPPMTLQADSQSARPNAWISVPDGAGNDAPEGGRGAATWTFTVPRPGTYVLWGDVAAPAENDNSFYVSMDGGEEIAWHAPAPGETTEGWTWDPVSRLEAGTHTDPLIFSLEEGEHRLRIRNREDGTRLRRLQLTNVSAIGPKVVRP